MLRLNVFQNVVLVILCTAVASCQSPQQCPQCPKQPQCPKTGAKEPSPTFTLNKKERDFLRGQMENHAVKARLLMQAAITMRYDAVDRTAGDFLLDLEDAAAKRRESETMMPSTLPQQFEAYQATLYSEVKALQAAAREKSVNGIADGFGRVMTACARCHGAIRYE